MSDGANWLIFGYFELRNLSYYNEFEAVFSLNPLYINNSDHGAGVRLAEIPDTERQHQVRLGRGARLNLGQLLYEQLTQNPEVIGRFAQLGLHIRVASPEAVLEPFTASATTRLYFASPLSEVTEQRTEVYRYFCPNASRAEPGQPPNKKGIVELEAERTEMKEALIKLEPLNRPLIIVVEGGGAWVEIAYRPVFRKANAAGAHLSVFYADDTRWKPRPAWATEDADNVEDLQPWEIYLDKSSPEDYARYKNLRPDVVFIVSPDFTHSALAQGWLGKTPLVFVEKPFDSRSENVDTLLRALGQDRSTAVLGLDHYQAYALPIHTLKRAIVEHLNGALAKVVFYMTEDRPIERGRERSLQHGLTLDLLPHLVALISYFGDVRTIDEICVLEAGQYVPLVSAEPNGTASRDISEQFRNETASRITFTFQDYSGNNHRIACEAVVGKGFSEAVKYLEVTGRNSHGIRVDLNREPSPNPAPDYPWDGLFFLLGDASAQPDDAEIRRVDDPFDPKHTLTILRDPLDPKRFFRPLERRRYEQLIYDMVHGTSDAVAATLLINETPHLVRALDRIWNAIQDARPWCRYPLQGTHPVSPKLQ